MSVEDQFEGDERALSSAFKELLDVRMKDKRKRYVHSQVLPRPHFIWPGSTALTALMPLPA
ncbi:MAG: hypothetical protein ACLU0O_01765 [Collinsella sp.]